MKHILNFVFLSLFILPTVAGADASQDAAYDKNESFVVDSWGKCVRTKWMDGNDPCNPTPPPPPPPPPAPRVMPAPKPVVSKEQRTVYFAFDSAALDQEAVEKLSYLAATINKSTAIKDAHIIGYADQIGTSTYNQVLSERRVKAVEAYLDQYSRLDTQVADIRGLGEAPESNCSHIKSRADKISCMRTQRRVEIEFTYQRPR